ncbi:transposable element Tc1 transposase [Trichonephila clavata]|uniref:Transposable element Tc1 transposase n=1 Tax=Trichonephila clavata TaxID=2740835 RepID=A0A8X6LQB3_TRICU|nr:transposable element Tc1 transposase [Trichonephila clavata]
MIDPKVSTVNLAAETTQIICRSVGDETMRNIIRQVGCKNQAIRKKPFISSQNQKRFSEVAKIHELETNNFWMTVIFSNESEFLIFGSDHRRTV